MSRRTQRQCLSVVTVSAEGKMKTGIVLILVVSLSLVVADLEFIDLTHTFGYRTVYWPLNPPFNFSKAYGEDMGGGVVVEANYFQTAEHSGTHMDAPRHFCPNGKRVHQVPLDKLSGPGIVLDFVKAANKNADLEITLQHLKDWEEENGMIPEGAIVLMNFGWNKYWPEWKKVFKSDNFQDFSTFHYPGMSGQASDWLAKNRKIHALGTDAPSPDFRQTKDYPVHVNLLCKHGVIILENVGNIDALPVTGSRVYIGALKLEHGSGTPVRLFATVGSGCSDISSLTLHITLIIVTLVFTSS